MNTLRIGLIGCGDIGRYVAFFSRLIRRWTLSAVCDADEQRAEAFRARYRAQTSYTNYLQMFEQADLDAVYIAVPHHLHWPMTSAALERGLPVLLEKPLADSLADARQIVEAAETSGIGVAVNYQYRYDRGCYALARAAQRGDLGELRYIRCHVPWLRGPAYFEQSAWHRHLDQSGGGTLLTQGSHLLDVALWAAQSPPIEAIGMTARRVFETIEVEDLAQASIRLENGVLIQISSSMVSVPEQAASIEVYGERGTAIYSSQPRPHVRFVGLSARREAPPTWGLHALQRSLIGFRDWILDGRPYLTPAASALPVMATVDAVYRSARTGLTEPLYQEKH
ncbi:MAG: Gfo/Idh/MocA family oxidoreductase [Chloroflexi bacterium]|nr:Gfo/Idh/MocA family oxidoreductase [Chloroflexota bacterium]